MFVSMDSFTEKFILAARNDDIDNWINILFVVILAIFWAVGGIIKGKTRKTKEMEDKTIGGGEPRRPGGYPKRLQKKLKESLAKPRQIPKAEPPRPRPIYQQQEQPRREVPRTRPYIHKQAVPIRAEKDKLRGPSPAIQKIQLEPKAPSEPATPTTKQIEYLTEPVLDLTDPDELKKAILHYEILGVPKALRDPSGDILRF
jgi:hypothetical protein